LDDFSNISIYKEDIEDPAYVEEPDPVVFLYQLGYLSLREGPSDKEYNLDYSNTEIKKSMAKHLLQSYFKSSNIFSKLRKNLVKALSERDPEALVEEFNLLLANIPYDDYQTIVLKEKFKLDEAFYRSYFFTYLYALGLNPIAEKHISDGRPDFIIEYDCQVWVIVLKVAYTKKENQDLAEKTLDQIIAKKYGDPFSNPVLLGAVVFAKEKTITNWKCLGGLSDGPV
jgi:hypothetical protein